MGEIWAIILAAGESKRMGYPKMSLPFNGSTMLETVIRNVKNSGIGNIIVVLGAEKERLEKIVTAASVNYCHNDNYKSGMLSSVLCGLRKVPSSSQAVLVFQGDQPLISPGSVRAVIDKFNSSGIGIVIPVYDKKRGHPILFDIKYRADVERLDLSKGLRALTSLFPEDVVEVETNDPGILRDFDTYNEYIKGITKSE